MSATRKLFASMVLLLATTASATAADYVAYVDTKQGHIALPEDLGPVETEHLVAIDWAPFGGSKARVAVSKVDNTSNVATYSMSNNQGYSQDISFAFRSVPINGIEAMITDAMNRSGRFRMVERQAIGNVLQEQNFGASGRVAAPSAAKIGNVLGAEYLVEVVITSYEPGVAGNSVNVGALARNTKFGGLLGGLNFSSQKSLVGLNFRLVDAATSEVIFTRQIDRMMTKSGLHFGGGGYGSDGALGAFIGQYSKTPIGQAVMAAINEGVYELVKQVGTRPVTGSVVKAQGSTIYLNLGRGQVRPGDQLSLWHKGEALIDPETGLALGSMDSRIGSLEVGQVNDRFSIARVVSGGSGVKAGDRVKALSPPEPLRFGELDPALTGKPNTASRQGR